MRARGDRGHAERAAILPRTWSAVRRHHQHGRLVDLARDGVRRAHQRRAGDRRGVHQGTIIESWWVRCAHRRDSWALTVCGSVGRAGRRRRPWQAYTSQFIALVMVALYLGDDRISSLARRRQIIDDLKTLPGASSVLERFTP